MQSEDLPINNETKEEQKLDPAVIEKPDQTKNNLPNDNLPKNSTRTGILTLLLLSCLM